MLRSNLLPVFTLTAALSMAAPAIGAEAIPLAELEKQTHYHGLAVDPADPSRLYLATHHGFYLLGADGLATRLSEVQDLMGFTPHPTDPSILYASGHPGSGGSLGFIMSANGGASWTQISPGLDGPVDFHQMAVSPTDPRIIYGVYGSLQVSRDSGQTWSIAGAAPEGLIALAASARSPDRLYGATRVGLVRSEDAGASWQASAFGGEVVTMVATGPGDTLYAYVVGRGLMTAKEDKPDEWSVLSPDPRVQLEFAIDRRDPNRLFAIAHKAGVIRSTDGGKSWEPFGQP